MIAENGQHPERLTDTRRALWTQTVMAGLFAGTTGASIMAGVLFG